MPRYFQGGLTLVEMLVVLVISSLVATMLIQGSGFFLNNYQRVLKRQDDFASQAMVLGWFRGSVEGLVASQDEEFSLTGNDRSLKGYTLQSVRDVSGRLVPQQWKLEESGEYFELWLEEGEQAPMLISSWLAEGASLSYRGQLAQWYTHWPIEDMPAGGLPLRIKLTLDLKGEDKPKEIYASISGRRIPRLDFRDSL